MIGKATRPPTRPGEAPAAVAFAFPPEEAGLGEGVAEGGAGEGDVGILHVGPV